VFIDLSEGVTEDGSLKQRGSFKKVKAKLDDYKHQGLNCLYLMGSLERDNGGEIDSDNLQMQVARPDASPLAITCRKTPNTMLGGRQAFKDLVGRANELGINIMIDCVLRVSSARMHRKYRKHTVN